MKTLKNIPWCVNYTRRGVYGLEIEQLASVMRVCSCYCIVGGVLSIITFGRKKTDVWQSCHFLRVLLLFDRNTDNDGDLVYISV